MGRIQAGLLGDAPHSGGDSPTSVVWMDFDALYHAVSLQGTHTTAYLPVVLILVLGGRTPMPCRYESRPVSSYVVNRYRVLPELALVEVAVHFSPFKDGPTYPYSVMESPPVTTCLADTRALKTGQSFEGSVGCIPCCWA